MKRIHVAIAIVSLVLGGCGDGVPHVADPHNPTDESGNPIRAAEFMTRYCKAKISSETCAKVRAAASLDATRSNTPNRW